MFRGDASRSAAMLNLEQAMGSSRLASAGSSCVYTASNPKLHVKIHILVLAER